MSHIASRAADAPDAPDAWLATLRRLLAEAFALHQKGASGVPLGRAYGAADGYMLALIDLGATNPKELSALVADERFRLLGPATRILVDREAEPREESRPFRERGDAGCAA
ncbi:MAG: hypothetical protein RL033_6351 [Pseudomonadota bacterium]|jgi:hypothetical protein